MVLFRRIFFGLIIGCCCMQVQAQIDSLPPALKTEVVDTIAMADSSLKSANNKGLIQSNEYILDTATYRSIAFHPYLPLNAPPIQMFIDYRKQVSKDSLFYTLLGIGFLLALIKLLFPKYFRNVFLLFFQTSLRQKQTRDQLLQERVAAILINLLFISSGGLFITLLIQYKNWSPLPFALLSLYICGVLVLIYAGKYIFIQFIGWVFNSKTAASGYLFQVFMVNRILGVILLPLSAILAFAKAELAVIVITVAAGLGLILFLYRYLISFGSLKNDLQLNAFHFFLYLCAVEILPMVLIYKLLVDNIG
ncbi:MAG: DUF4271 domain-containing protein [Sphingobacteriia bacterium]|nr:MAG: DUF4271 domain-containing protein [Sphingobacteriia bacterium]TAG30295.1 MAG: DUF4271 domain-containing protein [Sphingobacteriia bacterium]TAH06763.1 MAG: DUF4271 domain-containing protein [Sphingobacteriia bacterium]